MQLPKKALGKLKHLSRTQWNYFENFAEETLGRKVNLSKEIDNEKFWSELGEKCGNDHIDLICKLYGESRGKQHEAIFCH